MPETEEHDAIIIGGGPAGISCALELHDSCVDYLILERKLRLGGQLPDIENSIRNFAARYWESGAEVQSDMEQLCEIMEINSHLGEEVKSVDLAGKIVKTDTTEYRARVLLLATGYRLRRLEIEGVDKFQESIVYNSEKSQEAMTGKSAVIVGGGDNALMDALFLADFCKSVTVIHRSENFKARPDVLEEAVADTRIKIMVNHRISKLDGEEGRLEQLLVENTASREITELLCDFLVVKVGYDANTELFADQLQLDNGHIAIDSSCRTKVEGVFAAGDIVKPGYPRIATSVGHGIIAAGAIRQYLDDGKWQ